MFNNQLWQKPAGGGGADFYDHQISKSCRFDGAGKYLRTNGSAPTLATKYTFSTWIKRSKLSSTQIIFGAETDNINYDYFNFRSDNLLEQISQRSDSYVTRDLSVYRDTSAYYHLVFQWDTTLASATDRLKVYVNGVRLSWDQTQYSGALPQDTALKLNQNGASLSVAYTVSYTSYFNGYMAQTAGIDGSIVAIGDLGETKNGVWIAKDLSGLTFGNNGFLLDYASSGDMGNDVSGNNNDFTPTSISTHDQMVDSPTFGSSSTGNCCTLNPLTKQSGLTITENNLKMSRSSAGNVAIPATMGASTGKYYFEVYWNNDTQVGNYAWGFVQPDSSLFGSDTAIQIPDTYNLRVNSGNAYINGAGVITMNGTTPTTGTIIGIAIDFDNGKIFYGQDGGSSSRSMNWNNSNTGTGVPASGTNPAQTFTAGSITLIPAFSISSIGDTNWILNFGQSSAFSGALTSQGNTDGNGQGDFYYSPPTGFTGWATGGLSMDSNVNPQETDDNFPQKLFNPLIWTGDGTTSRAITGLGFQPDWLWFKSRSSAFSHRLYDTSRGISGTGGKRLSTNSSNAENDQTSGQDISAVGTDGFTLGASSNLYTNDTNSGGLQVGWFWRANGGTTAANGNGGTSSVTQVDPSGALSIVTYTGFAGASGTSTVGHGLSTAPTMIIHKSRTRASGWWTQVPGLLTDAGYFLNMESDGSQTNLNSYGTMNAPSTSVFTINGVDGVGGESANYVAYCFANIEGYCKVGSYVGNADDDVTFLYTGFRPAFFMCKPLVTGNWRIQDDKRTPFNVANKTLFPNRSDATLSNDSNDIDIVSNGVKMRASDSDYNQATTFIYLALAENPFKFATAR